MKREGLTAFGLLANLLLRDIGEVERMIKALIKLLENKHLNP